MPTWHVEGISLQRVAVTLTGLLKSTKDWTGSQDVNHNFEARGADSTFHPRFRSTKGKLQRRWERIPLCAGGPSRWHQSHCPQGAEQERG